MSPEQERLRDTIIYEAFDRFESDREAREHLARERCLSDQELLAAVLVDLEAEEEIRKRAFLLNLDGVQAYPGAISRRRRKRGCNHEPFVLADRFVLEVMLGSGGTGEVWRARDLQRQQVVALKMLYKRHPELLYRFKKEFRALVDVQNRNLVRLYELFSEDESWFFTMELLEGHNFIEHVRESGGTNYERLRPALRQLAEGVRALHAAGWLHRDLKPANVFVTLAERVVLVDFGLTREVSRKDSRQSLFAGTPAYMAPEQACRAPVGEECDAYAIGVMLYEALTGRLPFDGTDLEVLEQKRYRDPLAPTTVAPDIPTDLNALCMALLARNPVERPTMEVLLRTLQMSPCSAIEPARSGAMLAGEHLIGRKPHLAHLMDGFRTAKHGQLTVVDLSGPPGVGKSRLLHAFFSQVGRDEPDAIVLAGRCHEGEVVPFKALDEWVDSISSVLRQLERSACEGLMPRDIALLARLFPVLLRAEVPLPRRGLIEPSDEHEARRRAFLSLIDLLARLAERVPVVLCIDDLQWGDADSASFFRLLLAHPGPPGVLLVVSYRTAENGEYALLKSYQECLQTATPAVRVCRMQVEQLKESDAIGLAEQLIGPNCGAAKPHAAAIAHDSCGNPLLIEQMVLHLKESEEFQERRVQPGRRRLVSLKDVLRSRLLRLTRGAEALVQVVAVAGRPLPENVALKVAGCSGLSELHALLASHLLRMQNRSGFRHVEVYHDRIREIVVSALSSEVQADLHLRLAKALEGEERPDATLLALHYHLAGRSAPAVRYAVSAAEQARRALAFDQAARFYQFALNARVGNTSSEKDICLLLADALSRAGRSREAADAYLQAAATAGTPPEQSALRRKAAEHLLQNGNLLEGLALLEPLAATSGIRLNRPAWQVICSILWTRFRVLWHGLTFTECAENECSQDELARLDTYWSLAMGYTVVSPLAAVDYHARHLLLALQVGEPSRVGLSLCFEATINMAFGGRAAHRTARLLRIASEIGERLNHVHVSGMGLSVSATAALLRGDWRTARDSGETAIQVLKQRGFVDGCARGFGQTWNTVHAALNWMGEWRSLAEQVSTALEMARERGDAVALGSCLTNTCTNSLAQDRPERALQDLQEAQRRWREWVPEKVGATQFWFLFARLEVLLYQGQGLRAWSELERNWPSFRGSEVLLSAYTRLFALQVRARCAVAAYCELGEGVGEYRQRLLRIARKEVRRLTRHPIPCGAAMALLVEASIWALDDRNRALGLAGCSEIGFRDSRMAMYEAVARVRRGQLLGSEQGSLLIQSGEQAMRNQGVVDPERITNLLAPGKWVRESISI